MVQRFRSAACGALVALLATTSVPSAENPDSTTDQHWAFRPLRAVAVSSPSDKSRARTPIDALALSELERRGLGFAPSADAPALLRRLSFDLLGLPPDAEGIAALAEDTAPDAWDRRIERLLASPQFGERWARHWLDGAGYVDVHGGDNDAGTIKLAENKWLYRDYVVRTFNTDLPFAQFLTEQLAGDELVDWRSAAAFTPEITERLIATGFLRISADDTNENELNTLDIRYGVLHRTCEIVAGNLLGLTLQCAKCHDHKYEPIPQRDYYSFQAIFQPALNPDQWLQPGQRQLPAVAPVEKRAIDQHNAELDRQLAERQSRIDALRGDCRRRLADARLAAVPEPIRADTRKAIDTPADRRSEVEKYLAAKFEPALNVKPEDVTAGLTADERATMAKLEQERVALTGQKRSWQHWQVVYDSGPATPTRLLKRGDHLMPGDEVAPGFFTVLGPADSQSLISNGGAVGSTSGRRLALARWMTSRGSPAEGLVARVQVNRIWQHLLGLGLVETPDNFGLTGMAPVHTPVLEWLAHDFVAEGGHFKSLIRKIVASSVYRQSSHTDNSRGVAIDPENRLLWRQRLRRLESESIRDALLASSGQLDRSIGGPPVPVEPKPDGSFVVKQQGLPPGTSALRRTLYLLSRRNYHPTLLAAFDQPALTTNCTYRPPSAVVLQSLTMLNDPFVLEQAAALADRIRRASDPSTEAHVAAAFLLTLGRPPSPHETQWCVDTWRSEADFHRRADPALAPDEIERRALTRIAHTLLNTSEFLYVP